MTYFTIFLPCSTITLCLVNNELNKWPAIIYFKSFKIWNPTIGYFVASLSRDIGSQGALKRNASIPWRFLGGGWREREETISQNELSFLKFSFRHFFFLSWDHHFSRALSLVICPLSAAAVPVLPSQVLLSPLRQSGPLGSVIFYPLLLVSSLWISSHHTMEPSDAGEPALRGEGGTKRKKFTRSYA